MSKYCPNCGIEMIDKNQVSICPRNDIGECSYDGYRDAVAQNNDDYSLVEFERNEDLKVANADAGA
ncbi:hypothetical protein [Vibrio tetraodonis]|uniref:hypothetical protein n=1 Tax=Vibrio tetraodonis TaxID=2231647 RepID=UPI000E0AFC5C|nr:hypothetical protein [Vibrio tetraodonis]